MDWIAARSYYIGYGSIDRFDSLIFFYNYFCSWSLGIIFSLILPILYVITPKSLLQTKRTIPFFIICMICLTNMFGILIQPHMLSGSGEPILSINTCRFIVYLSAFSKPMGLYLILLFSIERIFIKILSNLVSNVKKYRLLFKKIYFILIFIGICFILSIRLYHILKYIKNDKSNSSTNNTANSTDRILNFKYCYRSIDIKTYSNILSFYVIQYWFEYFLLALIGLSLICIIVYQYYLSPIRQDSMNTLSVNTKLYIYVSSYFIVFELVLLVLHSIVDDIDNNNTDTQVNYLEGMLFIYNIRCILLPLIICLILCNPLREFILEFIINQSYLDQINENDQTISMINPLDLFQKNNNEHLDS